MIICISLSVTQLFSFYNDWDTGETKRMFKKQEDVFVSLQLMVYSNINEMIEF